MKVYNVDDPRFRRYGTIVQGYDFSELIAVMAKRPIPEAVEYAANDDELEALPVFREFADGFYGGMPVGIGYCMGHNDKLNAFEYHRGSEVNISVTDYIMFVGCLTDVDEHFNYDTKNAEAFYVPAGLAVEFYATTLHYCACHVREGGYSHATFLPRGTNCPLEEGFTPRLEEDYLLAARNKWMLVHKDGGFGSELPVKLIGENLSMSHLEWKAGK